MNTKKCKICNIEKSINDFYKHTKMKDGHLNICISCKKDYSKKRDAELRKDVSFINKEKERSRKKYHRLNYKEKYKKNNDQSSYRSNYPEKILAKNKSQRIIREKDEYHHWSYLEKDYCNGIHLTIEEHYKIHRYTIYDQERKLYRRVDNNLLLDTKEQYIQYMNYVFNTFN